MRAALVLALVGAVWSIHRRAPEGGPAAFAGAQQPAETMLRISIRQTEETPPTAHVPLQLYSVDVAAAQREFFDERRAGMRFEDFLARRMGGQRPITTQLDEQGQATVAVPPGRWWIHLTLSGQYELTWRLPVNVAGRERAVELTPENVYTRTKSF